MKNLMQQHKIKQYLKEVESYLEEFVQFDDEFISKCALSNLRAGGKRLRPLFVILTAQYFGIHNEQIVRFASIMELIHMSSLIHDDVNDNSDLRRSQKTLNSQFGNDVAVHIGDYILIEALKRVYDFPQYHSLLSILSDTAIEMSKGEVAQINSMYAIDENIESYYYRIERKTALLIAVCCQTGAILCNASPEKVQKFYDFGYHLGMAFQIKDDLMDVLSDNVKIGKPIGHDLENGLMTLPTILLLQEEFPEKDHIANLIKNHFPNGKSDIDYITKFISSERIIKRCEDYILDHINMAKKILFEFDKNEIRDLLESAADYIYERSK